MPTRLRNASSMVIALPARVTPFSSVMRWPYLITRRPPQSKVPSGIPAALASVMA